MEDLFVSYSQEDGPRIQTLVEALGEEGWSIFWDRKIYAGQDFRRLIQRRLKGARCIVVAWSKRSKRSSWVISEAEFGRRRRVLVPIRIDRVLPPLGMDSKHVEDFSRWDGDRGAACYTRLVLAIRAVLGGSQMIQVGTVRFPEGWPEARKFNVDSGAGGDRELRVHVAFDLPFKRPPKVVVGLQHINAGDFIVRLSADPEKVDATGFDLYFRTSLDSKIYKATASWIAVGD